MGTQIEPDMNRLQEISSFYRSQLLEDCIPFWLKHSLDHQYGGYLTMLERDGTPYGTGKYIWTQAREAYLFSKLYNVLERNPKWLEASRSGVEFLNKYALDGQGRAYYKVARDGVPIYTRPWQIFAESFVVLAYAEFSKASGKEEYLEQAKKLFWNILDRLESGDLDKFTYVYSPRYTEHAPGMILINTAQELRAVEDDPRHTEAIRKWIQRELYTFAVDEHEVMFERVGPDGRPVLSEPEGRSVTPGHCLESCWFCLREGVYLNDKAIIQRACRIMGWTMRIGWDPEYGGIYNFVDAKGKPPGHQDEGWGEDQDWDAKIFWVHSEALCALLYAYTVTRDEKYFELYQRVHDWSFEHFPDPEYGEWFGYLRRDGSVSQTLKGGVKGFFHMPRAFLNCYLLANGQSL
ncbi:MAG: AGE family epimerase/isomerase [Spirochaetaceae bacterium]|nr:MAG: AGE family epimerase/isomerase [Spirochaetaceae bacterium]